MSAPVNWWLGESVDANVRQAVERICRLDDVVRVAVLPDVHVAGDACVGTVMATRRLLYPATVGGDIGCGMLALAFDVDAGAVRRPDLAGRILSGLTSRIPQSRRHRRHVVPWPEGLQLEELTCHFRLADDAELQLGTLGGGNHFVELQADESGQLWLMLHTGSRAVGQAVRAAHAARKPGHFSGTGPTTLDASTDAGQAYLRDATWASRYAAANRAALATCVAEVLRDVLDARPIEDLCIECDHNHVRAETHDGETVFVHRKGAMPAGAGVSGVLPGSMGTRSYHVEGRGCEASLRSSAHGAGRRYSRSTARERFERSDVKHQLCDVWYDPRQSAALREELPGAYKDVRAVLRAQEELVRVTRTLRPALSFKGR